MEHHRKKWRTFFLRRTHILWRWRQPCDVELLTLRLQIVLTESAKKALPIQAFGFLILMTLLCHEGFNPSLCSELLQQSQSEVTCSCSSSSAESDFQSAFVPDGWSLTQFEGVIFKRMKKLLHCSVTWKWVQVKCFWYLIADQSHWSCETSVSYCYSNVTLNFFNTAKTWYIQFF